ncbi:hypothetical protein NL676_009235 [Syzygium grande]|nr:hypothetical protein NL676_009235 [Syzygium grande]
MAALASENVSDPAIDHFPKSAFKCFQTSNLSIICMTLEHHTLSMKLPQQLRASTKFTQQEERERERERWGVVIIDGTTVRAFVADEEQFKRSVDEKFAALDVNGDGVLSRSELRRAFESMRLIESHFGVDVATPPQELTALYDSIFERFDGDGSGAVDPGEFRSEMRKIMLAIADGLGSCPIQMALEEDDPSFLKRAADLEASKLAGGGAKS